MQTSRRAWRSASSPGHRCLVFSKTTASRPLRGRSSTSPAACSECTMGCTGSPSASGGESADRKSVGEGKRVDLGGGRIIKKKKKKKRSRAKVKVKKQLGEENENG